MYILVVGALMFVLPLVSIVMEVSTSGGGALGVAVVGKWFVFWAVGVRLLLAGFRQMLQPRYTAETILGIKDAGSFVVVRELGFANTAIGAVGVGSLLYGGWILPAALAGAIFYGLAGINHTTHTERNRLENVAMVSDLFIAALLLAFCLLTMVGWH